MPNTERMTRLEGLHAIQYRIHHAESQLWRAPTVFDPRPRQIALAEAFDLVQQHRDHLVYCVVVLASDS